MGFNFENYTDEVIELRRYFHQNPEASLNEYNTVKFIDDYLQNLGLETKRIGPTGLLAMIWSDKKDAETLALRAEMDAVKMQEQNGFSWASQNEGVMHACGHDGILATTLIVAKIISQNRDSLPVNVKLIFQPGEENGTGAQMMIKEGVLKNPKVDYFTMFHFVNDAPLGMELNVKAASAAIGSIKIMIKGKASHWSMAGDGVDSIEVMRKILNSIHEINKEYSSKSAFVLGIGTIQSGTSANIIAEKTTITGTLRAMNLNDYYKIRQLLIAKIKNQTDSSTIDVDIDEAPIPPIYNDSALVDQGFKSGQKILGKSVKLVDTEFLSGDNGAYFFEHSRGIYFIFTAEKDGQINYPLHNGKFDFDESILIDSVKVLFEFIMSFGLRK